MGKRNAKQKRQQALKRARKDGKVTRKEAKKLSNLGVPSRQITSTKKGTVKVTPAAQRSVGRSPSPSPTPSRNTGSSSAVSNAQNTRPSTSSNVNRGDNGNPIKNPGSAQPGTTGNVRGGISGKQADKILRDFKNGGVRLPGIPTTTIDDDGNEVTTTTPGEINYDYYNNNRIYGKAKNALNIRDISKPGELEEIRQYALSNRNPNAGSRLTEYGIRASGEFDDIVAALGGDAQAGYDVAEQMRKKGITMTDPRYEKVLNELAQGVQGDGRFASRKLGLTFKRLDNGKLAPVGTNQFRRDMKDKRAFNNMYEGIKDAFQGPDLSSLLDPNGEYGREKIEPAPSVGEEMKDLIFAYDDRIDQIEKSYQDSIDDLKLQVNDLGDIADGYKATNQYLEDQIASTNNYLTEANRRATNMANAFVPNANPNASSVLAGDYRKQDRKKKDNQLSDLAVLTDVGPSENPLAGLQLA